MIRARRRRASSAPERHSDAAAALLAEHLSTEAVHIFINRLENMRGLSGFVGSFQGVRASNQQQRCLKFEWSSNRSVLGFSQRGIARRVADAGLGRRHRLRFGVQHRAHRAHARAGGSLRGVFLGTS